MQIFLRPQPFQAISFDLDDTLYDNRPAIMKAEAELLHHMHLHHPATSQWQRQDWRALKMEVLRSDPTLAHDPSRARIEVIRWGLLKLGYGSAVADKAAGEAFACFYFHRSDFQISTEVKALLQALATRYRLVGITNGNVDSERIGLAEIFEFTVNAGDGMRMKPFPDMFIHTQKRLQLPPQQILHIGDSISADVAGARRSHFQAGWLNPSFGRDRIEDKSISVLPHIRLFNIQQLATFI